jgi:hypothetical protein
VIACVKRGKNLITAENKEKSSPKFIRYFHESRKWGAEAAYCAHAEMALLDKIREIRRGERIHVFRITHGGKISMAKPCDLCQRYLKLRGVRSVDYTDWDGRWVKLHL